MATVRPTAPDAARGDSARLTTRLCHRTVPAMDTMKILLGATVALLLAAVGLSWKKMQDDNRNASPEEIARVEQQITQLRLEQERLKAEKQLRDLRSETTAAATTPTPAPASPDKVVELETRLAETQARLAEAQAGTTKAERDASVAEEEAGLIAQRDLESRDRDLRRSRQISQALLIATVTEFVEDEQLGSFAVIAVQRPESVQPGTVLDVRRNTGILGKLKVSEVSGAEAVANPVPESFFGGKVEIQPGDELIIPPPF